jgi:atypical dual specificity phosphatase
VHGSGISGSQDGRKTSVSTPVTLVNRNVGVNSATSVKTSSKKRKDGDDNDDDDDEEKDNKGVQKYSAIVAPKLVKTGVQTFLGTTILLYVLNQKHMLPRPLSAFVSRKLFWPTLPITISRRFRSWYTEIDENVVLGGLPLGFMNIPETLQEKYNVKGVINMCEEYKGPIEKYEKLGIEELWLPTTDHFEPTVEDMKKAVDFIKKYGKKSNGEKVYVHCRAGHGRSAAIVYAYLLSKNPNVDMKELNEELSELRNVRKKLWKQENLNSYQKFLTKKD